MNAQFRACGGVGPHASGIGPPEGTAECLSLLRRRIEELVRIEAALAAASRGAEAGTARRRRKGKREPGLY